MKIIFTYIFTIVLVSIVHTKSTAQFLGEYRYFGLKIDFRHSFGSPHQIGELQRFIETSNGSEQLISKDKFHRNYCFSIGSGLVFNYDFKNDYFGIVTGIQYSNYRYKSTYYTSISDYKLKEINSIHSFGIPLYIKLGKKLYRNQRYITIGIQYDYNFCLKQKLTDWEENEIKRKGLQAELNKFTPMFFIGFNYKFLNIEIDYHPKSFHNKNYIDTTGYLPYNKGNGGFIFIKTSFNIVRSQTQSFPKFRHFIRRIFN